MMNDAIAFYRRTLVPVQIGIVTICAFAVYRRVPLTGVLILFVTMQLCAILGALWGARLQRRVRKAQERNSGMLDGRTLR